MPQRRGKPGSVTAATHTGQLVKPVLYETPGWQVAGFLSAQGTLRKEGLLIHAGECVCVLAHISSEDLVKKCVYVEGVAALLAAAGVRSGTVGHPWTLDLDIRSFIMNRNVWIL